MVLYTLGWVRVPSNIKPTRPHIPNEYHANQAANQLKVENISLGPTQQQLGTSPKHRNITTNMVSTPPNVASPPTPPTPSLANEPTK